MTRTMQAAILITAAVGVACTGPRIHVEWHRETVPASLLAARTDSFTVVDEQGIRRGAAFTHYDGADDLSPVLYSDVRLDAYYRGKNLHVVGTYLDANGRVLCAGEGRVTADDGATLVVTYGATGTQ